MTSVNTETCMARPNCRDPQADTIPDVPPNIDPLRPPQRNDDNCPCQCGWGCMCGDWSYGRGDRIPPFTFPGHNTNGMEDEYPNGAMSDRDDNDDTGFAGEEGAEEHLLVDVEHHGPISLAAIYRALMRLHQQGMLPECFEEYNSPLSTTASGIWSPSSMTVEHDSGDHSVVSSQVLSMRAPSPTYFSFMGGPFEFEQDGGGVPGSLFNAYGPIWMAPEILRPNVEEDQVHVEGSMRRN